MGFGSYFPSCPASGEISPLSSSLRYEDIGAIKANLLWKTCSFEI